METLPFLLVALLALCLMPPALALKCQECTNVPGYTAASQCGAKNVAIITCGQYLDKCMSIKGILTVPGTGSLNIELRNCSNSILCDSNSQYSMCKLLNITGMVMDCKTECCQGDLCNDGQSAKNEAIRISGLVSSFAVIFLTVVLNLLSGFY